MSSDVMVVDESTTNYTPSILQPADVNAASELMENWEKLNSAIINEKDIQKIGKKDFKKKSAWRKYALAYNLSDDVIDEEIIRDECQRIISAKFKVKCIAPNGRYTVGVASCSIWDKISDDDVEEPTPFQLRKRFSHAEHDIISTAHTRAKNRAISDMLGVGEVSAEEAGIDGFNDNSKKNVSRVSNSASETTESTSEKPKRRRGRSVKKTKSKKETETSEPEMIETKAEVVSENEDKPTKSLKEYADENPAIKKAVNRLQGDGAVITKVGVVDELFNMLDLGKISLEEYDEAKELLS